MSCGKKSGTPDGSRGAAVSGGERDACRSKRSQTARAQLARNADDSGHGFLSLCSAGRVRVALAARAWLDAKDFRNIAMLLAADVCRSGRMPIVVLIDESGRPNRDRNRRDRGIVTTSSRRLPASSLRMRSVVFS
jgi:hypothetical protein